MLTCDVDRSLLDLGVGSDLGVYMYVLKILMIPGTTAQACLLFTTVLYLSFNSLLRR